MSTATVAPTVTAASSLDLSYNYPLQVPQNFTAVCNPTTQAVSILQVQNLSTSFTLAFFVLAGSYSYQGSIPANTTTPWSVAMNFEGAKLTVSNISSGAAFARVTLLST